MSPPELSTLDVPTLLTLIKDAHERVVQLQAEERAGLVERFTKEAQRIGFSSLEQALGVAPSRRGRPRHSSQ